MTTQPMHATTIAVRNAKHMRASDGRLGRIWMLVAVAFVFGALGSGGAWAYWTATSSAGSNAGSAATSVNGGATPTASATGAAVTVSWSASTLVTGQAVSGYLVKRYDATTLVQQTILTACSGTVATTSCVESAVPDGTWKYTVTPVFATNWRGAESAKSATVRVDTVAPTNALTLSSVTGGAFLSGTTVYYRGTALGSFTLTNAVADAGSGAASSQTATLTGTTTGWSHTPSTVSTPAGGPYVSNAFSWTAGTTSGPGEAVTGRDVTGNTAVTNLTFTNDVTGPSGATVSYVNGLSGGTSITVTLTNGTDPAGIGTRLLQRASATATMAGACGTFGSFATVTGGTNPALTFVDTVTLGSCYMYQYVVADNVGNSSTATSASVARAPYGATYSLNENTGTTTADGTGMGNTGTFVGSPTWATGRYGSGVSFPNSTASHIDIPRAVIDSSQSYSVSAWVKFNGLASYQTIATLAGNNISPFNLQLNNGTIQFAERAADAVGSTLTELKGPVAQIGVWYHAVGVYDKTAGTMQLYVNGISQGTAAFSSPWKATVGTIIGGSRYGTAADPVNGVIDEVGFYDRALTAAEVVALRGPLGAYWTFNEGSGTTAADSTGNTNTGTLQTGASWTTGKIGSNAVAFNGTTGYVDVPTPVVDTTQSYTVATWVKVNSLTAIQTFASVQGVNITPFQLQLTNTGSFKFVQYASDSTASTNAQVLAGGVATGTWYHVAGVYDKTANTVQLYVNGVSAGSVTATTAWAAYGRTTVGRTWWNGAATDFVNGAMDETHFYSRALTQNEITILAGSYSTVVSGTTGLLNYWRLGEGSGTTATDTKSANNGTYFGTPTLGVAGVNSNDTNTAVTFNGSTQYVQAARQISTDFSVEFWFKSTQSYSNDGAQPHCNFWWQGASLVDNDLSGAGNDFGVSLCSGKVVAGAGDLVTGTTPSVASSGTYNDGAWHQVVMTRTQSTGLVTLYVDGASVGTVTATTNAITSQANVSFGRSMRADNYFAGTLDEVAFYNVALTGATVVAHYNAAG